MKNVYGLMKHDGNTLHKYDKSNGIQGRITGIIEDNNENLWFGTAYGLILYDGNEFSSFTEENGLIYNEIWSLYLDSSGLLWIGTSEGLCTFDGKNFESVPLQKAAVRDNNTVYTYDRITAILEITYAEFLLRDPWRKPRFCFV